MGKINVSPALVLRHVNYRDADRIVTLFTRDHGLIAGIARGIRRSVKRFGGRLDLFTLVEVTFRTGRGLHHLESATLLDAHMGIRSDLLRIAWAAYLSEMVEKLFGEEQAHEAAFATLLSAMKFLSGAPDPDEGALRTVELALLMEAGYRPELDACVVCRRPVREGGRFRFVVTRGGCVCGRCPGGEGGLEVSETLCTVMSRAVESLEGGLEPLRLPGASLQQLRALLGAFESYHLGVRLKSAPMLHDLLQESSSVPRPRG